MLRIYPVILEMLKGLQPALRRIELRDRDMEVCSYVEAEQELKERLKHVIGTLVKLVGSG